MPAALAADPSAGYSPAGVVRCLQELYSKLLGCRRPYVEPDFFHRSLLKDPWGDKKQQDAYQFLLYLLDSIGTQCGAPLEAGTRVLWQQQWGCVCHLDRPAALAGHALAGLTGRASPRVVNRVGVAKEAHQLLGRVV